MSWFGVEKAKKKSSMPKLIKLRVDQTNLSVQMASFVFFILTNLSKLEMATHQ